jgi:hypothetical protein
MLYNNNYYLSSPKLKINDKMMNYLKHYNAELLERYTNSKNLTTTTINLPPIDPNHYFKLFSLTHIFSFLAGYYLSNILHR